MRDLGSNSKLYLSLGSNLGEREEILAEARASIEAEVGAITASSSLYETEPFGFESLYPFLNQAIEVVTDLEPRAILYRCIEIERRLGRTSKSNGGNYQDRTCDIDLILYGDRVVEEADLVIPHPRFRERAFVLEPLAEIAPEVIDPVSGLSIAEILKRLCPGS